MKVEGVCKLCNEKRILVKGHIFPRFIRNWIDENIEALGGSKTYHHFDSINGVFKHEKNKQDLIKDYLFCNECDNEKLSIIERDFNEKYFIPITKGTCKLSEKNSSVIFRFSVSIVFRVLNYSNNLSEEILDKLDDNTTNRINDALDECRSILLKKTSFTEKTCLYFGYLKTDNGETSFTQLKAKYFLVDVESIMDLLQEGKSLSHDNLVKIAACLKRDVLIVYLGPLVIFANLNPRINFEINNITECINIFKKVELVEDPITKKIFLISVDYPKNIKDAYLHDLIKLIQ